MSEQKKSGLSLQQFHKIKEGIDDGHPYQFTVVTDSMAPLIQPPEQIIVVKHPESSYQKFDVIVFFEKERLVCHYISHINHLPSPEGEQVYITRGLKNTGTDYPVSKSMILGLVVSHRLSWLQKIKEAFRKEK